MSELPLIPRTFTSAGEAFEYGYFFSNGVPRNEVYGIPPHPISGWTIHHRDHRVPLATNLADLSECLSWSADHARSRRGRGVVRKLVRGNSDGEYGERATMPVDPMMSHLADDPAPAIMGHYDDPPLAVGTVPEGVMVAARAYVDMTMTDPRTFAPRAWSEAQDQTRRADVEHLATKVRFSREAARAFDDAIAVCQAAGCPAVVLAVLDCQAKAHWRDAGEPRP